MILVILLKNGKIQSWVEAASVGLQKYHVIYLNTPAPPAPLVFQKTEKGEKTKQFSYTPQAGQRLAGGCYQGIIAKVSVFGNLFSFNIG